MSVLTKKDHDDLDCYLGAVLDAYKTGKILKEVAVGELAEAFAALDNRDMAALHTALHEGRMHILQSNG